MSADPALEGRIREWIEAMIGRPLEGTTLREGIMDMRAPCELINRVVPNRIPKIHNSKILMFRRDNFGQFASAALELGVIQRETCSFEDIYEDKNMKQAAIMFVALARKIQFRPDYSGPKLADAVEEKKGEKIEFTEEQLRAARSALPRDEAAKIEIQREADKLRYNEHNIVKNPGEAGQVPPPK